MSATGGNVPTDITFGAQDDDADGYIVYRQWRMPDGSVRHDQQFNQRFDTEGYYLVELTVADNDGLEAHDAQIVYVSKDNKMPPRIASHASLTAAASEPYHYDLDDVMAAQGTRPLFWSLGKTVNDTIVNAPTGMGIDPDTGQIHWTPAANQAGEHAVTVAVRNGAGHALQEFVITVAGDASEANQRTPGAVSGCGCTESGRDHEGAATMAVLIGLALLLCQRRRRFHSN